MAPVQFLKKYDEFLDEERKISGSAYLPLMYCVCSADNPADLAAYLPCTGAPTSRLPVPS
ncbi:MAG: hypothetical protein NT121_14450 [Chloroflexi bacterium]|nr:hypothetical protein [Chloroflexota bacterium]